MCRRSSLPEVCTLRELHDWLVANEEPFRAYLKICQLSAAEIVEPIHDLPSVRITRGCWQSNRPFPGDEQLLLLALLLSPQGQLTQLDEETIGRIEVLLCTMGLPGPVGDSITVRPSDPHFSLQWAIPMAEVA